MSSSVEPSEAVRWTGVVEHSPVPTLLVRADHEPLGLVVQCNQSARALFGDPNETSIVGLVDTSSQAVVNDLLNTAAAANAGHQAIRGVITTHDGRHFALDLRRATNDVVVAHLLVPDDSGAVDEVLAEQHRFRSALMELSDLAHSTQDDDDFYQRLIERAVEVVPGAQGGSVQLHIPGTTSFRFVAALGYDLAALQRHELEQRHFFRDAWDPNARILHSFENSGRTPEIRDWLMTVGRLAEIAVNVSGPVLSDGFPVAFLSLDNFEDPDAMNETSIEMTTVLSRLIGDLWRRRELETQLRTEREALRHLALHDPLTGLANRRNFEGLLSDAIETGRKLGQPSCVLFVDIDDFKGVNDRLGHEVGDQLLIGVARGLETSKDVVVGRWGGDEFLVLPHGVQSEADALAQAMQILQHFEDELTLGSDVTYRARISVGVAWSPDSSADITQLIRGADEALYEAKAAGKGTARIRNLGI